MLDKAFDEKLEDRAARGGKPAVTLEEHIVEVVSDSGEGAQKCGQSFGSIAARTGNGIWTVEIIPAEIQPPARSIAGASGNRVRLASHAVSNVGDEADLVVAFNEQVLLGRLWADELKPGCIILLESKWITIGTSRALTPGLTLSSSTKDTGSMKCRWKRNA